MSATTTELSVDSYLAELQHKLVTLLASGWRTARRDAEGFEADCEALQRIGLKELAERIDQVSRSTSSTEALKSVTLALSASNLVRTRLAFSDEEDERVRPFVAPRRTRTTKPEMMLPLSPIEIGGTALWSCLRSRGYAVEWIVIDPPDVEPGDQPVWFRRPLFGQLHWQSRIPLDSNQALDRHRLPDASWEATTPPDADPFAVLVRRIGQGKIANTKLPLWGGGSLRVTKTDGNLHPNWQFLSNEIDNEIDVTFATQRDNLWAVVREQEEIETLIALFDDGDDASAETVGLGIGQSLTIVR